MRCKTLSGEEEEVFAFEFAMEIFAAILPAWGAPVSRESCLALTVREARC